MYLKNEMIIQGWYPTQINVHDCIQHIIEKQVFPISPCD